MKHSLTKKIFDNSIEYTSYNTFEHFVIALSIIFAYQLSVIPEYNSTNGNQKYNSSTAEITDDFYIDYATISEIDARNTTSGFDSSPNIPNGLNITLVSLQNSTCRSHPKH